MYVITHQFGRRWLCFRLELLSSLYLLEQKKQGWKRILLIRPNIVIYILFWIKYLFQTIPQGNVIPRQFGRRRLCFRLELLSDLYLLERNKQG